MREIKFRAWDGFKMYEPCVWMGKEYIPGRDTFVECDFMQFTGLKDKNGVDIYEGDIVSFLDEAWQVIYFESYASFMLEKGNDLANITTQEEVVGNVYQNPHLLNTSAS